MPEEYQDLDNQTEEVEESQENETAQEGETEAEEAEREQPEAKSEEPAENDKEHNRKGYEYRKKAETGISREEFEKLNQSVQSMAEENKDLKFRNAHPEVDDDVFNSIKALSKGTGKNYEEIITDDPIIKAHLDSSNARSRVNGATATPSGRTSSGTRGKDWANMSPEEFAQAKNEVITRRE